MRSEAEILLAIRSDTRGAAEAIQSLKETQKAAVGVSEGFNLAAGAGGAYALTEALKASAKAGIMFNAQLEDTQLGLAGIYRQFRPKEFENLDSALAKSAKTVEQLKKAALDTTATFGDLLTGYQSIAGAAFAAGIPIERQVRLTQMLSQAVSGLGLPSWQLAQEGRALLTGNIDHNAMVARTLGITGEQVTQAKAQGKLYEFLEQRLKGLSEAGARANQTFSGQWSNLQDRLQQMFGTAGEPAFNALKGAFAQISATLARPEVQQGLNNLGAIAAKGINAGAGALANKDAVDSGFNIAGLAGGALAGTALASVLARLLPSATDIGKAIGSTYQIGANALGGLAASGSAAPLNSIAQRFTAGGGAFAGTALGPLLAELSATGGAGAALASLGLLGSAGLLGGTAVLGGGIGYLLSGLVSDKFAGNLGAALGYMSSSDSAALQNGDSGLDVEGRIRRYREGLAAREDKVRVKALEDRTETEHRLKLGTDALEFDYKNKLIGFKDYFAGKYGQLRQDADLRFAPDASGNVDKVGKRRFLEAGYQNLQQMDFAETLRLSGDAFSNLRVKSSYGGGRFAGAGQAYGFANSLPTFQAMLNELKEIRIQLRVNQVALT
jgi:hypothetical protein